MEDEPRRNAKSMIWGFFLVALGSVLLLDRFGMVSIPELGRLWPLILIVIGVTRVAVGRPASSVTFFLLGAWFLACEFDWYGLTYSNSWPLILVAIGASMVLRAIVGEGGRRRMPGGGAS
jgi:hypothetical protein